MYFQWHNCGLVVLGDADVNEWFCTDSTKQFTPIYESREQEIFQDHESSVEELKILLSNTINAGICYSWPGFLLFPDFYDLVVRSQFQTTIP